MNKFITFNVYLKMLTSVVKEDGHFKCGIWKLRPGTHFYM